MFRLALLMLRLARLQSRGKISEAEARQRIATRMAWHSDQDVRDAARRVRATP